jgi:hypothetical protein
MADNLHGKFFVRAIPLEGRYVEVQGSGFERSASDGAASCADGGCGRDGRVAGDLVRWRLRVRPDFLVSLPEPCAALAESEPVAESKPVAESVAVA